MSPTAAGEEITATVKDNTGAEITEGVSYSWKLGDAAAVTTATYTVPETAKAGDKITLTITVGEATATATATVKAAETEEETYALTVDASKVEALNFVVKAVVDGEELKLDDEALTKLEKDTKVTLIVKELSTAANAVEDYNYTVTGAEDIEIGTAFKVSENMSLTITPEAKESYTLTLAGEFKAADVNVYVNGVNAITNTSTTSSLAVGEKDTVRIVKAAEGSVYYKEDAMLFDEDVSDATSLEDKTVLGTIEAVTVDSTTTYEVEFTMPSKNLALANGNLQKLYMIGYEDGLTVKLPSTTKSVKTESKGGFTYEYLTTTTGKITVTGGDWAFFTYAESTTAAGAPKETKAQANITDAVGKVIKEAVKLTVPSGVTLIDRGTDGKVGGTGAKGDITMTGNRDFSVIPGTTLYVSKNSTPALFVTLNDENGDAGEFYVVAEDGATNYAEGVGTTNNPTTIVVPEGDAQVLQATKISAEDGITVYLDDEAIASEAAAKKLTDKFTGTAYVVPTTTYMWAVVASDKGTAAIAPSSTDKVFSAATSYSASNQVPTTNLSLICAVKVNLAAGAYLTVKYPAAADAATTAEVEINTTGAESAFVKSGQSLTLVVDTDNNSSGVKPVPAAAVSDWDDAKAPGQYTCTLGTSDVTFAVNDAANEVTAAVTGYQSGKNIDDTTVDIKALASADKMYKLINMIAGENVVSSDAELTQGVVKVTVKNANGDAVSLSKEYFDVTTEGDDLATALAGASSPKTVEIEFGYISVTDDQAQKTYAEAGKKVEISVQSTTKFANVAIGEAVTKGVEPSSDKITIAAADAKDNIVVTKAYKVIAEGEVDYLASGTFKFTAPVTGAKYVAAKSITGDNKMADTSALVDSIAYGNGTSAPEEQATYTLDTNDADTNGVIELKQVVSVTVKTGASGEIDDHNTIAAGETKVVLVGESVTVTATDATDGGKIWVSTNATPAADNAVDITATEGTGDDAAVGSAYELTSEMVQVKFATGTANTAIAD